MKKLFFVHIPKTGGTSLRAFLERAVRERGGRVSVRARDGIWSDESESYASYESLFTPAGAATLEADLVCGHYPLHVRELLPPDTQVIVLLRHPVTRCLSHIKHQMALERQTGHPEALGDVNAFVAAPRNEMFLASLANLCVKYLTYRGSPDDLVGPDQLSAEAAVAACNGLWVGLADELGAFQERLRTGLLAHRGEPLPVRFENVSADRFGASELTPENLDRLLELNRLDLHLFERAKEGIREGMRAGEAG